MKEARAALQKLSAYAQKQIGKVALQAAAKIGSERVKARAKVGSRANDPTRGSLQRSVRDKPGRPRKGAETRLIVAEDVAAVPKEFGLSRRNYPAEPFFRPAIDGAREEMGRAVADTVKDQVENGPWR